MRIIAFVTEPLTLRAILAQPGEPTVPPRIAPAGAPPLWEATVPALAGDAPRGDPLTLPDRDYEFDQRIAW